MWQQLKSDWNRIQNFFLIPNCFDTQSNTFLIPNPILFWYWISYFFDNECVWHQICQHRIQYHKKMKKIQNRNATLCLDLFWNLHMNWDKIVFPVGGGFNDVRISNIWKVSSILTPVSLLPRMRKEVYQDSNQNIATGETSQVIILWLIAQDNFLLSQQKISEQRFYH